MKYKAHIPTEQYGFIEVEGDDRDEVVQEYFHIAGIFKDREGHNTREWARVRRDYLNEGKIEIEDLEKCNKSQRFFINEVKKHLREDD